MGVVHDGRIVLGLSSHRLPLQTHFKPSSLTLGYAPRVPPLSNINRFGNIDTVAM
ncbi:MAG: hypothetical protein AAGA30_02395 [Planctomycetota bacterium]